MTETFVFDTNSLISAYILDTSVSRRAYNKAFEKGVLIYSTETLNEFAEKFVLPKFEKYLSLKERLSTIEEFRNKAFFVNVKLSVADCRDPKDNKFLSLALTVNAGCIVSGDGDLLILNPYKGIPILKSSDFLTYF